MDSPKVGDIVEDHGAIVFIEPKSKLAHLKDGSAVPFDHLELLPPDIAHYERHWKIR